MVAVLEVNADKTAATAAAAVHNRANKSYPKEKGAESHEDEVDGLENHNAAVAIQNFGPAGAFGLAVGIFVIRAELKKVNLDLL